MAARRVPTSQPSESDAQIIDRLSQVVRRLLARVIRQHMKRALGLTIRKWRIAANSKQLLDQARLPHAGLKCQQGFVRKLGIKRSGGSPNARFQGGELGGRGKKEAIHPLVSPRASKRQISVSPNDSPSAKTTTSFQLGPLPSKSTLDVGTRLYQKAQEIESKLDALRKAQEPEYTFTPSLARNTDRWLSQKSAKSTPKKLRAAPEEDIAVVSSATAVSLLSRIAEIGSRQDSGQVKKVYPPVEPSSPYVLVDFTGDDPYLSP